MKKKLLIKILLIGSLMVLASCGTTRSINTPVDDTASIPPLENKKSEQPTVGVSALKLLEIARRQAEAGQDSLAAATLERAIKIEPDNPWLWHRLAVLRMQQKEWSQAVELATRSNALAKGNQRLLGGNWLVISLAQEGIGNYSAAVAAKKKSAVYLGK